MRRAQNENIQDLALHEETHRLGTFDPGQGCSKYYRGKSRNPSPVISVVHLFPRGLGSQRLW